MSHLSLAHSLSPSLNNSACPFCCLALVTEPPFHYSPPSNFSGSENFCSLGFLQMMVADRALMIPGSTSTASTTAMEKQSQNNQAATLKCPRCDSSNTKFCYYNNYSLSQPRHFCKACKRYWTRGGTLRSVPVGGGCRKNKRVKKPSSAASAATSDTPALAPPPPPQLSLPIPSQIDVRPADLNPLFYPLPSDIGELNFPALRHRLDPPFSYDLHPQFNGLGPGFSPNHQYSGDEYRTGFGQNLSHLQQSTSLLHDYQLIGSSWSQPKKAGDYQALLPFEDLLASVNGNLGMMKQVKVEGEYNGIDWQLPCENPLESMTTAGDVTAATAGPADSSFLYWNLTMGGATGWPDTNYESSVAPLI